MISFTLILALLFVGAAVCGFMVVMIEAKDATPPPTREMKPRKIDAWAAEEVRGGRF